MSCLSHFTHVKREFSYFSQVFSYVRPEDQSLLQIVFKDTRSSSKSSQWRNAPGFTCCSDKACTLFHQILTLYSPLKS